MNPTILALFGLLEHAPAIEADSVSLYSTIAHGEGGLGKVQAALLGFTKLVEDAISGAVPQTPAP